MADISDNPENTGRKQDGQFSSGVSGNPKGRPKGSKNKTTQAATVLLEGEAEALTRKAIELAINGDLTALKLCLDRIVPSIKSTAPIIELDTSGAESLTDMARTYVDAASDGQIPPDIAAQMISALTSVARLEEMENIKYRLQALEVALKSRAS